MAQLTRRSFVKGSAAAASLLMLAGCNANNGGGQSASSAPAADKYPIEPEKWGSGTVRYSEELIDAERTGEGWTRVSNNGGTTIGVMDTSMLIQVDGFAFKDMNGNGKLDIWEDWRQDTETRAAALAAVLDADEILPNLMVTRDIYISGKIGSIVDDIQKKAADDGVRSAQGGYFFKGASVDGRPWARWSNELQAYCEGSHNSIPMHLCADPFNAPESEWPGSVGLAATFDPQAAWDYGYWHSREYRALGIQTVLGPQMDVGTEPRWSRNEGTFGEDPALARDMAKAETSALQSTWDADGNDEGWGTDSVVAMIKHWPGDGAGMFGWESHNRAGRFSVFPNGNFALQTIPFVDGAFKLDSSTSRAGAVMPSYSIAFSRDEEWGENVGTAFSDYKMKLLREACGFDDLACSDWQVIDDGYHTWGVDGLSPAERVEKGWKAGVDQWGGQVDITPLRDGYELLKKDLGDETALELIRNSVKRVFRNSFRVGLFDNPYLDPEESGNLVGCEEARQKSHEVSVKSIVMLKNSAGLITAEKSSFKPTVYVPKTYAASSVRKGHDGDPDTFIPATFDLPVDEEILGTYFNVVTDSVSETLTGEKDPDGNPTISPDDIILAGKDNLAVCDYACVFIKQPVNVHNADGIADGRYIPVSLTYGAYTADGASGCPEQSPAGEILPGGKIENLSPYGNTSMISNAEDLESVIKTANLMGGGDKVIACINSSKAAMVMSELEPAVGTILYGFNASKQAFLDIVCGKAEPSGLLPFQMPADMQTVERQSSDTPRDMDCYEDASGNVYDFGFGLNWSGVIRDDRVEKYCVDPITKPESIDI